MKNMPVKLISGAAVIIFTAWVWSRMQSTYIYNVGDAILLIGPPSRYLGMIQARRKGIINNEYQINGVWFSENALTPDWSLV